MKLEIDNVWAVVKGATDTECAWLESYLSCEDDRYKRKGLYSIYDPLRAMFPAGLALMLPRAAATDGIDVELIDSRESVCAIDLDRSRVAWLRDYQWNIVRAVCYRGGRGLIKAPTGSGKSELLVALTRVLPCEWLFVVHRADLVGQTAARYQQRTGETAGTFESGVWKRGTCNITVSTFQAISRAMKRDPVKTTTEVPTHQRVATLLQTIEALFVDEVHCQSADSFYRVSMALENAYYRIGASGTPLDKSDRANLRTMGALGPVLTEISTQSMVKRGVLAKSQIQMAPCQQWAPFEAEWAEVYRDLVVRSKERNMLVAQMAEHARKPCLLFVKQLDHGRRLIPHLHANGLIVDFANGQHWIDQRKRKIRELVRGNVDVLMCTVIFQEGIDVPELESVVVGCGGATVVAALQRIGRGMRRTAGKTSFEVWDVLDRGQHWIETHAWARWDAYEREGHTPKIVWSDDSAAKT